MIDMVGWKITKVKVDDYYEEIKVIEFVDGKGKIHEMTFTGPGEGVYVKVDNTPIAIVG